MIEPIMKIIRFFRRGAKKAEVDNQGNISSAFEIAAILTIALLVLFLWKTVLPEQEDLVLVFFVILGGVVVYRVIKKNPSWFEVIVGIFVVVIFLVKMLNYLEVDLPFFEEKQTKKKVKQPISEFDKLRSLWKRKNSTDGNHECYINEDQYCNDYGGLYLMKDVSSGLCPRGYHIATIKNWEKLLNIKLLDKEGIPVHYRRMNEIKYFIQFGGHKNVDGNFKGIGEWGTYWVPSNQSRTKWNQIIIDKSENVMLTKTNSNSVRAYCKCIKND
jgi:uncharacterized protein (TIGR02145 family)